MIVCISLYLRNFEILIVQQAKWISMLFSCLAGGGGGNKDRVLLEKVAAITLEHGKMTNARRTSAIPQVCGYVCSLALHLLEAFR